MQREKIKLIHVVKSLNIGGMENGVINICNALDREKFTPIVCCIENKGLMAHRLKNDVKLVEMNFYGKLYLFYIYRLFSFFKEEQADIVHTHGWGAGSHIGIVAAKLARISVIINGEHGSFFQKPYQVILQRFLFFLCNYNLSVSDTLKRKTAEILKVPVEKITVIRNGVDTIKFNGRYPASRIFQALKHEGYDVSSNSFNIFIIGSLKPEKSQIILLKAIKKIKEEDNGIDVSAMKILVVGDGPDMPKLQQYVVKNGLIENVFFLGNRNDIAELLTVADLLVSTSVARHEGLSNVLLEAMSSGVPVIATASVGSKEIVKNGYNGYLINEGDVQKLSSQINHLFLNREELVRLGRNARKVIFQNFSIDAMINRYEQLYLGALEIK